MADALQSTLRHPKKITKTTLNNIKKTLANASVFSIHRYILLSHKTRYYLTQMPYFHVKIYPFYMQLP